MALSIKDFIKQIPNEPDIRNSRYVKIIKRIQKSPHEYHFITMTRIPGEGPRKHKQTIKDLAQTGINGTKEIWVTCDCARFMYTWEYSLTKVGASSIIYSNGEPPVSTNPRMYPAGCKHCYVAVNQILKAKGGISKK